jgi:hypothetical protein
MHIIQPPLFDFEQFILLKEQERLLIVLEALDAEKLLNALERERWTGRKGYSLRGMWAALIAGVLHQCQSLAAIVRLLERNKDIRMVCGFVGKDEVPGEDAMGRFLSKLVAHEDLVEVCFESMVERLRHLLPGFGQKLVVDSTDIKAFSNGHRRQKSDPDARWGAKGTAEQKQEQGKKHDLYYWFGYKLHLLVDGIYELPLSFSITPANVSDTRQMPVLLEKANLKRPERPNLKQSLPIKAMIVSKTTSLSITNTPHLPSFPLKKGKACSYLISAMLRGLQLVVAVWKWLSGAGMATTLNTVVPRL